MLHIRLMVLRLWGSLKDGVLPFSARRRKKRGVSPGITFQFTLQRKYSWDLMIPGMRLSGIDQIQGMTEAPGLAIPKGSDDAVRIL